jgi:pimeloyl-ACP methyl ester carboxylesterase
MPKADVNGIEMYYQVEGSGPPLLFIMGLGGHRMGMAPAVPFFTDKWSVITFDNRGTGESSVPEGPYTIDQMGDDAAALIDHLDMGPVTAVGWSLGGCVLQSLLINHGDKLEKAVLLSTLPNYTKVQHPWLDGLIALREAGADARVLGAIGMPWGFTPKALFDHDMVAANLELAAQDPFPTTLTGFKGQGDAIRNYDSIPDLPKVTTPTLVLVGAEDVLTPPSQSVEMAAALPGAQLQILPRGGHGMLIEYLPETVAAIQAYID